MKADGISTGKIPFGELFIDHDGGRCPAPRLRTVFDLVVVVRPEVPPSDDGDAQSGKIVRTNGVHVGFSVLIGLSGSEPFDGHAAIPFVVFENAYGSQSHGL